MPRDDFKDKVSPGLGVVFGNAWTDPRTLYGAERDFDTNDIHLPNGVKIPSDKWILMSNDQRMELIEYATLEKERAMRRARMTGVTDVMRGAPETPKPEPEPEPRRAFPELDLD